MSAKFPRVIRLAEPAPDPIHETLALLRPEDLLPVWCYIESLENDGVVGPRAGMRWKRAIYQLMEEWGLEPDEALRGERSGRRSGPRALSPATRRCASSRKPL